MITAENERGARITRDASKFKKVNIQGKNKEQVRGFDWSDEEKEQPAMTTGKPELPQAQDNELLQETQYIRTLLRHERLF